MRSSGGGGQVVVMVAVLLVVAKLIDLSAWWSLRAIDLLIGMVWVLLPIYLLIAVVVVMSDKGSRSLWVAFFYNTVCP